MIHSLDHAIIAVRDLHAATHAYARLLGRAPSWRGEHPGWGTANALFRVANMYLELLGVAGEGSFARHLSERLERDGEGLAGLAFGTDDADDCARTLRERGLEPAEPVEQSGHERDSGAKRAWRNVFLPQSCTRGVMMFAIEHRSPADALPLAGLECARGSAVEALDHVVVRSAHPEATRELYGEKLGLRLALDRSFEQRGVRLLFFRVGGVTVEIASALDATPHGDAPDRLWGLAWRVPSADAARTRLADAGFQVSEVRPGNKPGTRVCTVEAGTCGVPTLLISPD
ncbi:MAG TPA: VOC family protein [Myxococcota bacterium]|nr:VOC family protein [Myxococcota bacterium]